MARTVIRTPRMRSAHRGDVSARVRASYAVAAFTSATMPARIAGDRSGHAATTAANSGSVGGVSLAGGVAAGVAGGVGV